MGQVVRSRMRIVAPALLGGLIVCAVAMVSALSGCRRDDVLKIGYLGTLSGRHSDLGVAGRDGAVFAVEEINRSGGINGRPVELVVRDDQGEADAARKAVREFIDAKVAAIVGPMTSSMAMATVPLVNESSVVMVSPTVSSNDLTGKDDNFLRVFPPSGSTARHLAAHARQGLGLKRVAVIYDLSNRAHTEGGYHVFRRHFETLGGEVTASATFDAGVPADFLSLTDKLLATRPQGVFILAGAVDTAMICQQIRKSNSSVALLASEWSSTPELIVHGGAAVEGVTYYQNVDRTDTSPTFTAFRRAYRTRFGADPDFGAVYAYQSVQVVSRGLASGPPPGGLKKAILAIGAFRGVQGDFAIDRFGDAERKPFLMAVRQGAFQRVEAQ